MKRLLTWGNPAEGNSPRPFSGTLQVTDREQIPFSCISELVAYPVLVTLYFGSFLGLLRIMTLGRFLSNAFVYLFVCFRGIFVHVFIDFVQIPMGKMSRSYNDRCVFHFVRNRQSFFKKAGKVRSVSVLS